MIKLGSNNIGKIYLGSNPIGKAYYGSDLVFQKGSSPVTTMVPYIRGGADGSYIDTGITPDETTKVIVWARNWNPASGFLFGSGYDANSVFGILAPRDNRNDARIFAFHGPFESSYTFANDQFANLSNYHKYEYSAGNLKVDDVAVISAATTFTENNTNIHLFGRNSADSQTHSDTYLKIDICACKIYKNSVLVRDYTAVNTPSVGLYDAVSDTVFTNAGTGSFTYGSFNPNAYTPLEYIASSGSSYIQTNINATYSMRAVACFMPTGTVAQFYRFLGARDTSPTNMFEFATGNSAYRNSRLYLSLGTAASTAYQSSTNDYFKNKKLVAVKLDNKLYAMYANDGSAAGNVITGTTDTSFTVTRTIIIFTSNGAASDMFIGRGYYVLLGDSSFVPAKKGSRVGMYDTYNDVFYESETDTPFTAGPEI